MGNTSSTPSGPSLVTETPALQPVHQGFNPTRQDAQIAGRILMGLRLSAMPGYLPSELALSILAHADYRPRITSFRAGLVNYDCCTGHQPWYLETPMLPPDFRRATSLTLQVRSDDRMDLGQYGANGPDGTYNHGYTWFEMCILRPLRRSGPPVCGGIGGRPFEARMAQTPRGQVDPEQDFQEWDEWLQVKHNGRETWVVRHNNAVWAGLKNYRIDWSADSPTNIEDSKPVEDSRGFLSALMPGDKIVLWAAAEAPALGITVVEAIIEIVYDV